MPREVVQRWHDEIEQWLREHGLAGQPANRVLESPAVDRRLKQELRRFKNRCWHGHLDDCHGECLLRDPDLQGFVSQSILHFNGERYDVERFVIMPNHVHVLIQMRPGFPLRKQFRAILRFSARGINKHLSRSGDLWQSEPFDHVVRNGEQFEYLQRYIDDNPEKAGLSPGEYTLWVRGQIL